MRVGQSEESAGCEGVPVMVKVSSAKREIWTLSDGVRV